LWPVLERLRDLPAVISVDTRSAAVTRMAIAQGARIINDVSAGGHEPEIVDVVADSDAAMILMHMSGGYPATPARDDPDIVSRVREALALAVERAAKIPAARIALDPGVGFGKTMADNWRLAMRAAEVVPAGMAHAVVLGVSRKRFLETPPPLDVKLPAGWENLVASLHGTHLRDACSAALTAVAAKRGVLIHRVHDVALAAEAIRKKI
jgi:dihydropteroate synthase